MQGSRFFTIVLGYAVLVSCGGDRPPVDPVDQNSKTSASTEVNTYIGDYIEIDMILPSGPGDADREKDATPFPPPLSAVTPTWNDWNPLIAADIAANNPEAHWFPDFDDPDGTSFPRSVGCVESSKVLSKMDLTSVALANNKDYAYFAVQRANNNGDAGWYWLMNKLEPSLEGTVQACKPGEKSLEYYISPGDVLLAGHFKPSSEPILRVFIAKDTVDPTNPLDAISAIDFNNGSLWEEKTTEAIAAAAVNTSPMLAGAWGIEGVSKQGLVGTAAEPTLEQWLFAEAAIETKVFTGGDICGASFWGTVITRSSGSGGTTPDLKDFFGPKEFSFGEVNGNLEVSGTCDQIIKYCATMTGFNDEPINNATCKWTITKDGSSYTGTPGVDFPDGCGCEGASFNAPPGDYELSVEITDPLTGCSATPEKQSVKVYPPVTAEVTLEPTCVSTFDYFGSGGGGDGTYSYHWDFYKPPYQDLNDRFAQSGVANGTVKVPKGNVTYKAVLTVKDSRGCDGKAEATTTPFDPVTVSLVVSGVVDPCATNLDTAAYLATATGGDEDYTFTWKVASDDGLTCSPMSKVDNTASCTMDPSDSLMCTSAQITVEVVDGSKICNLASAGPASYSKTTTVSASM
jgi:hypothetical protein